MERILLFIKAFFVPVFYTLEWTDTHPLFLGMRFRFKPKKGMHILARIIASPLLILAIGVIGTYEALVKKMKVQDWSSYYIAKDEKQTKWNAYKKF